VGSYIRIARCLCGSWACLQQVAAGFFHSLRPLQLQGHVHDTDLWLVVAAGSSAMHLSSGLYSRHIVEFCRAVINEAKLYRLKCTVLEWSQSGWIYRCNWVQQTTTLAISKMYIDQWVEVLHLVNRCRSTGTLLVVCSGILMWANTSDRTRYATRGDVGSLEPEGCNGFDKFRSVVEPQFCCKIWGHVMPTDLSLVASLAG